MKKIVVLILTLFVAISCVMEPPTTFYTFKIINKTKMVLFIESKQNNYTELSTDTLKQNQEFIKRIPKLNCYIDYHDTLIQSFFTEIKIRADNRNLKIDPFNRANWTYSNNLRGFGHCKGGTVYYTMVINNTDIK